jgi:CheY-like chemotaxis protein
MALDGFNNVRITVIDHGIGFDPDALLKAHEQGSGFGLLSIKERMELAGGKLEIESSPGKGAAFSLVFPITEVTAAKEPRIFEPVGDPVFARAERTIIRVLLADDHAVVRQGLSSLLDGYPDLEVAGEAADGEEAVRKTRDLQPDVILMDLSMPKMDGVAATRIIHSEFPHIRIIGLSMHDKDSQAAQMMKAGASAYCTKDGDTDVLLAAIRKGGDLRKKPDLSPKETLTKDWARRISGRVVDKNYC